MGRTSENNLVNVPGSGARNVIAAATRLVAGRSRNLTLVLALALICPMGTVMAEHEMQPAPAIGEAVIMLYYKDITAATAFYGEMLGLEMTFDQDSAKLFRLTPTTLVGVILEGETSYHRAQASNAVMLSVVTPDVDAWYQRLTRHGDITVLKPLADSANNPIRAFLIEDPGGYTVEFFSWLNVPEPAAPD